jgi:LmbE family N-acetylglucosaminyl deacetylase
MTDGPVLVVTAHPDDPEFLFGAAVASLTSAGVAVDYVICSDGSLGSDDAAATRTEVVATRAAEQRAAADVLGVRDVTFLGLRDGELVPDLALRKEIVRQIRRHRPGIVLTHFPRRVLDLPVEASHPDHVAVGEATLAAVYPAAGSPRAHPGLLAPHRVREVWIPGYAEPDYLFDATPFMDMKVKAMLCHRSQLGVRGQAPPWVQHYAEHFQRIRL